MEEAGSQKLLSAYAVGEQLRWNELAAMLNPSVKVTHRHGPSEANDSMLGGGVHRWAW